MELFENVILTDCDGALVYWEHAFMQWMLGQGFNKPLPGFYSIEEKYQITVEEANRLIAVFGESCWFATLPPMRDAIKYVKKLHEEHGYVFHVITSIPDTPTHRENRLINLENLFGKTAIERLVLCDHSYKKNLILEEYAGSECYWIEDLELNAEYGLNHGLKPILIEQHYNANKLIKPGILKVKYWKEIYETITGSAS